jgi:hypothetical protein
LDGLPNMLNFSMQRNKGNHKNRGG